MAKTNGQHPTDPETPRPLQALVVEANRGALTRTSSALVEAGLAVESVSKASEAVERIERGAGELGVVLLTVADETEPELVAHAVAASPEPRPALLTLFPRGVDQVEMESEAERLGAAGSLSRPIPLRALGLTAWALAQMVRARREQRAIDQAVASLQAEATPVDPRTRLYRFEHFKPLLVAELKRARRYGIPFSLLRVAFDALAEVELEHGAELVETLEGGLRLAVTRVLRDQDIAVDLGPGQILAVLPHTGQRGARAVAERIRRRVSKTRLALIEGSAGTTASLGLAVYSGTGEVSFADLIREATLALEIAQQAGGNRAAEVPFTRRQRT